MALPLPRNDRAALVTGASSGIGEGFARELAARRHNVVLVARRKQRLESLAQEIGATGVRAEVVTADLAEPGAAEALGKAIGGLNLGIDLLVNSAGFGTHGRFVDNSLERELEQVRVNMEALVALTGVFLPQMVERGRGTIINLASMAGFQPLPYEAIYGASKAFVLSFSEAVSAEVEGTGVSVVAVCPGPVPTEWQEIAGFDDQAKRLPINVSVEQVVRESLDAAEAGKRTVVPGRMARIGAMASRPLPNFIKLPVAKRIMRS